MGIQDEARSGGALRAAGSDRASIDAELSAAQSVDVSWQDGRLQGLNHFGGQDVLEVGLSAYTRYVSTNPVSRRAFPSAMRLQDDILASALDLLGGGPGATGTVTAGGTESIFLAMKSARDHARARRGITAPQMVMPYTAHPAFNRHAQILGITPVRVPVGEDYRADVNAVAEAITADTILLVGSAPCYPFGLFDPIAELAAVALDRGICMHVDACVGGFQAPFVRALGRPVPEFDLSVAGVTSISADLHKYGFSLKGASIVLFADSELKEFSAFSFEDWPRGLYATDTFSGTRSGGPVAAAWAILRYLGFDGYVELQRRIMALRDEAIEQIGALEGCTLIGEPELALLAFTPKGADMNVLSDKMGESGWILNLLRQPEAVQLMFNISHEGRVDEFFADFRRALPIARMNSQRRTVAAEY